MVLFPLCLFCCFNEKYFENTKYEEKKESGQLINDEKVNNNNDNNNNIDYEISNSINIK